MLPGRDSNPRPLGLETDALTIRPHVPMFHMFNNHQLLWYHMWHTIGRNGYHDGWAFNGKRLMVNIYFFMIDHDIHHTVIHCDMYQSIWERGTPHSKCSGHKVLCSWHCTPTVKQYSVSAVWALRTLLTHWGLHCAPCLHCSDFLIQAWANYSAYCKSQDLFEAESASPWG